MRTHLASLVEDFRAHSAETAVVSHRGVRRYRATYGDLAQLAGRFAAELEHRGISPGERVVLWGENSAEWIGAFFGCLLRGVLIVPLDAAGSLQFAERVLDDVAPRLVVADALLLRSLQTDTPSLAFSDLASQIAAHPNFTVAPAVREDSPFQIVFTSGTTSEPKGIVHTHRNVLASLGPIESEMAKYRKYERWVHPLRFLHTLPLSHVFGQFMGLWTPALLAAEVHFTDRLEPARSIEMIHRERISVLIAVPRVLDLLRAHLLRRFPALAADLERPADLTILKRWWRFRAIHRAFGFKFWAAIAGGASLPPHLEGFWNGLGFALIQGYGMTETAALVTLNHPFKIGQGTIGKVLPGREVQLSDAGEIMVRGATVSNAIWHHGQLQSREDEWLATGDLAETTNSGDLRFVGRKGDAIITSAGWNIYPADVEAVMLRQAGVRVCAVVGCELPSGVEAVSVVSFSGSDEALQHAVSSANRDLAEYQQIRRILRWPDADFPYTSTGKLLRREIKAWACAALENRTNLADANPDALLSMIAEVNGGRAAKGDDNLRVFEEQELNLDSLGRAQLGSAIEQRWGIELQDAQLAELKTLGQLRTILQTGGGNGKRAGGPTSAQQSSSTQNSLTPPQDSLPPRVSPTSASSSPAATSSNDISPSAQVLKTPLPQSNAEPRHIYPTWPWTWAAKVLRIIFVELVLRPLVFLLAAPRVVGSPQKLAHTPMLMIANHVTAYDGALVLYALPAYVRRHVAVAMSGEMLLEFRSGRGQRTLLRNFLAPAAYWLLTGLFNVFPLPQVKGFRRSFAHAGRAIDNNYSVLIFPEGTRSANGRLQRFRPGTGLLAEQARVPVLPIALLGLGELRSGKQSWFRSGLIEVRIGDLVSLPEPASPAEWTEALEAAMQKLQH